MLTKKYREDWIRWMLATIESPFVVSLPPQDALFVRVWHLIFLCKGIWERSTVEIFWPKRGEVTRYWKKENCRVRSLMVCTLQQMLLGWWTEGGWEVLLTLGKWEICWKVRTKKTTYEIQELIFEIVLKWILNNVLGWGVNLKGLW